MTTTKVFYGGIPTDIDIRTLMDEYPIERMKPGDVFTYREISKLIGVDQTSPRFRTVTNRWRGKVERETGKRIGAYNGEFFRVMTEQEKLEAIEAKDKSIDKGLRKNLRRIPLVDAKKLSESERGRLYHLELNTNNKLAVKQLRGREIRFLED